MSDDWKARLADLLTKIERARTQAAAKNALIAATDLSVRHGGGANRSNGERA